MLSVELLTLQILLTLEPAPIKRAADAMVRKAISNVYSMRS